MRHTRARSYATVGRKACISVFGAYGGLWIYLLQIAHNCLGRTIETIQIKTIESDLVGIVSDLLVVLLEPFYKREARQRFAKARWEISENRSMLESPFVLLRVL